MTDLNNTITMEQVWETTKAQLIAQMGKKKFTQLFGNAEFKEVRDDVFVIQCASEMKRDALAKLMTQSINNIIKAQLGNDITVEFVVKEDVPSEAEKTVRQETAGFGVKTTEEAAYSFNPRYTFDNFVVGSSNEFAASVCKAVAHGVNSAFNPLFLYSGVGLGKTHLLHAIGNEIRRTSNKQVLYVTTEEFTNDFIAAIQKQGSVAFREKYRTVDVLLIDDIQFLIGKESTQEEFFHTFNTLYGMDKQIVISSDRPAREMITLTERMRSRFESGITVDIQAPTLEHRIAILRSKVEKLGRVVPGDVLNLIAQRIQTNVRELEGALTRVLAMADLCGYALDKDIVRIALGELESSADERPVDEIIEVVGSIFGADPEAILSRNRSKAVALARQVVMYLLRTEENYSYPQIGEFIGGRDHSTIIHGIDKITGLLARDLRFQKQFERVFTRLYGTDAKPSPPPTR